MIERNLDAGLPVSWVCDDETYGHEWTLRRLCEQRRVGYVLAVPKSRQVKSLFAVQRADVLIAGEPGESWVRLSTGPGAKEERLYDWAGALLPRIEIFDEDLPDAQRSILARRSISEPDQVAYYLAYAPEGTSLAELARIAGMRWAIEECFQAAKNETGLGQHEVRRYPRWYRHITLAMLPTPSSRPWPRRPPQKGNRYTRTRICAAHRGRGQTATGTPEPATHSQTRAHPALVPMATTPPSHLAPMPLPAKTPDITKRCWST